MNPSVLLFPLLVLAACGPTPPPAQTQRQTFDTTNRTEAGRKSEAVATGLVACYEGVTDGDTLRLQVRHMGPAVAGELTLAPAKGPRQTGALSGGMMHGDTLLAHWTPVNQAETQIRQVAFLLRGPEALEGKGEMMLREDRQVFKDVHRIRFAGRQLRKVACP